ncbi:MAG: hypothetical protein VX185_16425 [Pseudomonadota bacterium]|nr:hypothetical protein [Pseudomonadota bacterium]
MVSKPSQIFHGQKTKQLIPSEQTPLLQSGNQQNYTSNIAPLDSRAESALRQILEQSYALMDEPSRPSGNTAARTQHSPTHVHEAMVKNLALNGVLTLINTKLNIAMIANKHNKDAVNTICSAGLFLSVIGVMYATHLMAKCTSANSTLSQVVRPSAVIQSRQDTDIESQTQESGQYTKAKSASWMLLALNLALAANWANSLDKINGLPEAS